MSINILLIDDLEARRTRLPKLLEVERYEAEAFKVATAQNSTEGLQTLEQVQPAIVLLDVHMPQSELDGWKTCVAIRKRPGYEFGSRGIIMFSEVKRQLVDITTGYYMGADRYLVTPFEDRQLIWEVKSLLRVLQVTTGSLEIFDEHLTIDWERHRVTVDSDEERLTLIEFRLLKYLRKHLNKMCSPLDLMQYGWNEIVWSDLDKMSDKEIEVLVMPSVNGLQKAICKLRKKLKNEQYGYIQTERESGYMMVRDRHAA